MFNSRMRRRGDSEGQSEDSISSGASSVELEDNNNNSTMGTEVVLRPHKPLNTKPAVGHYNHYEIARQKEGDVVGEKFVEERIRELGLLDAKRGMEQHLAQRLEESMEQDGLIGALKRCKSGGRRRPLVDRVTSVTDEITNIIRPSIVTSEHGGANGTDGALKVYKVDILMGLFTRNVSHTINEREVVIRGEMTSATKLSKEVTVEFPATVDITQLAVTFNAGVFRLTAPFRSNNNTRNVKSSIRELHKSQASDLRLDTSLETLDSNSPLASPNSACSSLDSAYNESQRPHAYEDTSRQSQRPRLDESGFCDDLSVTTDSVSAEKIVHV